MSDSGEARRRRPEGKNWCFTINNPAAELPDRLPRSATYLVFQVERGEQGGTRHLQGFIQFESKRRLSAVLGTFEGDYARPQPRGHWELARGNPAQNREYCTKSTTREAGPFEFGAISGGQGARTDLVECVKQVQATGNAFADPVLFAKYGSNLLKLAARVPPPSRPDLHVVCVVGDTGLGKSYACWEAYPQLYKPYFGNSGIWWDGYSGQEVVLFEEFCGQVPLQKMLDMLDPYPLFVEVKGGTTRFCARVIILLSNDPPRSWYPVARYNTKCVDALLRKVGAHPDFADPHRVLIVPKDREDLQLQLRAALSGAPVVPAGRYAPAVAVEPALLPPDQAPAGELAQRVGGDVLDPGPAPAAGPDQREPKRPKQEGLQDDSPDDWAVSPKYFGGRSPDAPILIEDSDDDTLPPDSILAPWNLSP